MGNETKRNDATFRFVSFRSVSFRFIWFRFVSFGFVSFRFYFVSHFTGTRVIIMGDMNARTGNESDFIENEFHNQNIPLFENYLPDSDIIDRFSRDHTILPRGRVLNDICM